MKVVSSRELARVGVPLADTQALLVFCNDTATAEIYTHADADDLRAAVERLQS